MAFKFPTITFGNKTKKRKYEGASKSKRMARWSAPSSSANSAIHGSLETLRNRARDLRRNNPYAAKGVLSISANVVGHGIRTQFRTPQEKIGEESAIDLLWKSWAQTSAIDFDGRNDIFGLQRLIMEAVVESGEVLVRKRFTSGLDIPLQYQVLESDFLDTNKNDAKTKDGNTVIQGIEFSPQGKRVAYYLFESHPGGYDKSFAFGGVTSNRVPVEQVQHIFRQDRPGQARGITWFAPVMVRMKDFDEFEDAQLMRQKVAACFTAFVKDIGPDITDDDEDCPDDLGDRLEPGIIEHLPPGKDITFANPPELQNYQQYSSVHLHAVAAGLGITYEQLTGDLSMVNFSSARMGWLDFQRNLLTWRKQLLIDGFLDPAVRDFKQILEVLGTPVSSDVSYVHIAPKREMIDPTREVPASIEAIRAGLTTLSDELLAQGKDPDEHLSQYKKDMDTLDKLGLTLESDPRIGTQSKSTSFDANSTDSNSSDSKGTE